MDAIDMDFVALPKIELHAHLTGSITRETLHAIWLRKSAAGETHVQDPLIKIPVGKHDFNLKTFFPLFNTYIYALLTSKQDIQQATHAVLQAFHDDGVVYLELRTTPRATPLLDEEAYLAAVLSALSAFEASHPRMHTRLILSIDRRQSIPVAQKTLRLALDLDGPGQDAVCGLDLCGDPAFIPEGEDGSGIGIFTPLFTEAREAGKGITVHFAEAETSASRAELETLLSWRPRRLGHVIWEDEDIKREIIRRKDELCLELCLSCNVHAGMITGGFEGHHFGEWRNVEGLSVAISTDDVGIFGSPLSNEYRLVAQHFRLDRSQICALARQPIDYIFGGEREKQRLRSMMWT